jgi:REP element-mobilizing transposase RayT
VFVRGGLFHAILRGNHRQPIFLEEAHYRYFDWLVAEVVEQCGLRLHAYCWMPNHVHLAVQVGEAPLGNAMLRIASRFARHVQRDIPTTGHLFEARHKSILVDETAYLLELVRYIHLNPVRARLVAKPCRYAWSSHNVYLGRTRRPWVTTGPTLQLFADRGPDARGAFEAFVLAGIGREPPEVLRKGETPAAATDTSDGGPTSFVMPRPHADRDGGLDGLIARVCAECGIAAWELTARTRSSVAARARGLIATEAVRLGLASLSDIARRFGRSTSTISECVRRLRPTDKPAG